MQLSCSTAAELVDTLGLNQRSSKIDGKPVQPDWCFLQEEEFPSLFLDGGPAVVFTTWLTSSSLKGSKLEFSVDVIVGGETSQSSPKHDAIVQTGDSYWHREGGVLEVGVARVVGPFRPGQGRANDHALDALAQARAHLLETLSEAVHCDAGNWNDIVGLVGNHPSPQTLLEMAIDLLRSDNDDVADYLVEEFQAVNRLTH